MKSWKLGGGLESDLRFATGLEAAKHGVDLAFERMRKTGEDDVPFNVEDSDDPVNAVHDVASGGARRFT